MIEIPELGDDFHAMWVELLALSADPPADWTLIGAHMVALHGWAAGVDQIRPSRDADILVDVRTVARGTTQMSQRLIDRGYNLDGHSAEGVGHRLVRDRISIDVLAPDGLGARANLLTTAGAHTVQVPGGTQALRRSRNLPVKTREEHGTIPVPNLLGALLVKIRAIDVDDEPNAQRTDVAFLLSLVEDPEELLENVSASERGWIRGHDYFSDPANAAYRGVANATDAAIAYRRLADRQQ
jgi:hypothetical protein